MRGGSASLRKVHALCGAAAESRAVHIGTGVAAHSVTRGESGRPGWALSVLSVPLPERISSTQALVVTLHAGQRCRQVMMQAGYGAGRARC